MTKTTMKASFIILVLSPWLAYPLSKAMASIGPFGGNASDMAPDPTDPEILYAGTSGGGVFKSTDGSDHWSPVSNGLANLFVQSIAIDPTDPEIIYTGTRGGVFKSTNGGDDWFEVNTGLTNLEIHSIAVDPTNSDIIYVGTAGGIFKGTSGGDDWSEVNIGLTNLDVLMEAFSRARPEGMIGWQ